MHIHHIQQLGIVAVKCKIAVLCIAILCPAFSVDPSKTYHRLLLLVYTLTCDKFGAKRYQLNEENIITERMFEWRAIYGSDDVVNPTLLAGVAD